MEDILKKTFFPVTRVGGEISIASLDLILLTAFPHNIIHLFIDLLFIQFVCLFFLDENKKQFYTLQIAFAFCLSHKKICQT